MRTFLRYVLFIFPLLLWCADAEAVSRAYAPNSVLSSGKWVKIKVRDEGVYQFTASELKSMGFSNPEKVHIYGYGGELVDEDFENAVYVDDLPEIPTFWNASQQKLVFYLRGTIGFKLCTSSKIKTYCPIVFTENYASDEAYYFLTENANPPLRFDSAFSKVSLDEESDVEEEYKHRAITIEKYDEYNYLASGRNWYGDMYEPNERKKKTFKCRNIVDGDTMNVAATMVASASVPSGFTIYSSLGSQSMTSPITNSTCRDLVVCNRQIQNTDELYVTFKYDCTQLAGRGYTDWILGSVSCWLNVGDQLLVRRTRSGRDYTRLHLSNVKPDVLIVDVSDMSNIKKYNYELSKDSATVLIDNSIVSDCQRLVFFSPSASFPSPSVVGEVKNQNLHSQRDIEYVIVTVPEFVQEANRLGELHKKKDGLSYLVVTQDLIFNEFSSGTPDPTAIRAFMKMLYDKSMKEGGIAPRYLLLLGDGCFDLKNNSRSSLNSQVNRVITYQAEDSFEEGRSYASEDYFGFIADTDRGYDLVKTNKPKVGVGRIPAMSQKQAAELVDKVEAYMDNSYMSSWKNKTMFLADDNEAQSDYHMFISYTEELTNLVQEVNPSFEIQRVYWDAYNKVSSSGSSRYPEVENLIKEKLSEGTMFVNYCGHGSFNSMSLEHPFVIADAMNQYNKRQGLWYAASCNVGQFDGYTGSLGEEIMRNPNGGGIAMVAANRTSYASYNQDLNKNFIEALFDPQNNYVIGDVFRIAKSKMQNDINKLVYTLLGDPALRLVVPELQVSTDSVLTLNDGVWVENNTLAALDKVKIKGTIRKDNGDVDESFNGDVVVLLKDKAQKVSTKANRSDVSPYVYNDYVNTLFSGTAKAVNGKFEYQVIIPKDINYMIGTGRITYYASDETTGAEAMGYYNSISIGGTPSVTEFETSGPKIKLYLNTQSFKNGDKVNSSPMLYAEISDVSGINASGCGIGHDISLYIDDSNTPININNRFSYNVGSCSDGMLAYHLSSLSAGRHSITLKAWDLLNNSSTATIWFDVDERLAPEIAEIVAYPVPASENITFEVSTDRPGEVITCKYGIFDAGGNLYYSNELSSQQIDGVVSLTWDLKDQKGVNVPSGMYVYRVELNTKNSDSEVQTKKFLIVR